MTNRERLLVAYFSADTEQRHRGITMQEVVSMLHDLGAKRRQLADKRLVVAPAAGSAPAGSA